VRGETVRGLEYYDLKKEKEWKVWHPFPFKSETSGKFAFEKHGRLPLFACSELVRLTSSRLDGSLNRFSTNLRAFSKASSSKFDMAYFELMQLVRLGREEAICCIGVGK